MEDKNRKNINGGTIPEEMEMEVLDEKEYQCGVGSFRPSCLQGCANVKVFTLVLSMVHIFGNMNFTYYTAVISEIERQFGLSSSVSGFIKNIDNIGYLCAVLLVSHFLRYASKPKIFSIATVGTSVAIFIFAMPHFIYGVGDVADIKDMNVSLPKNISKYELCEKSHEDFGDECNTKSILKPLNVGALIFFVVSELLQGIMQSPKFALSLTYLDDNAKKKSPLYFGILFATRSFSPVLGFLLGAWTTRLYVDLTDPGISQKDPRWVGAWWLGFVICSACSIVWALPLALFPAKFKEDKKTPDDDDRKKIDEKSKTPSLKELPKALFRLMKNPVLMCLITASCFNFYLMGFSTFTPKYLQNHFGMSASQANILTGIVSACSYSLGPIVSGRIMASKSINPSGALKFILVINCVSAIGFSIMGFLKCPEDKWAGEISLSGNSLDAQCNGNCSCDPYMYTPVCSSEGVNYFSPCYAGCTGNFLEGTERVFTNCSCINDGLATEGLCGRNCSYMLIPYIIVMIISKFSASMTFVPYMTVLMRCVSFSDKALALGFSGSILMVAAFPAPVLFGMMIDSTCLFKQSSCSRQGACLLYDLDLFRIRMHIFAAAIKVGAICMYIITLLKVRQIEKRKEIEEKSNTNGVYDGSTEPMIKKNGDNSDNSHSI